MSSNDMSDIFFNMFIFFAFGSIIGSFINVLALRIYTGRSFVKGRSKCFACNRNLEWYELVPVLSYFFLRGKCRTCDGHISLQYPIVELLTGIIFALLYWKLGITIALPFYLITAVLLLSMSVYDFNHKIIPNEIVYIFNFIAILFVFFNNSNNLFGNEFFLNILGGIILYSFFAGLWWISSGKWMGYGDAKLALGAGWLLGISGGIFAIMLSFWIGAIVSVLMLIFQALKTGEQKLSLKSEIPFAPFIILGIFIQILSGINLSILGV